MAGKQRRGTLLLSTVVGSILRLGNTAYAAEDPTYRFDIPPEPLGQALTDFSQAAAQQIIYSESIVKGRTTSGLHGSYTAAQALQALLAGTELRVDINSSGMLMIRAKNGDITRNVPSPVNVSSSAKDDPPIERTVYQTSAPQTPAATTPSPAAQMQQPAGFRNFPDIAHLGPENTVFAPARGRIVTHFGDPTETGGASKGLVLETRAGAQIVAPFDGRIAFEGPFRSYGQILIIEHGGGYHTVLAGLDRVDAVVGQYLLAGEPVGVMGSGEESGAASASGRPRLYLELRRDGQPIDPVPWFGAAEAKAVNNATPSTNKGQ